MRSWGCGLLAALAVVQGVAFPCFAQAQPGPATLENLVNASDVEDPSVDPEAEAATAGRKPPAGTVARPSDGVQHPDLDTAWVQYDAAVAKIAGSLKAAIAKQLDAATAKGDLDAAERWQTAAEQFEKAGALPADSETKAAVSEAVADYKKAIEELGEAYEAVVKALTMDKKIPEAKAVREEFRSLDKRHAAKPEESVVFLADLQEQKVIVGWGTFGKGNDLGYGGDKIVVAGQAAKKGLSMHPPANGTSTVTYTVPAGFKYLKAKAANNDTVGHRQRTPLVFRVTSGDRILWQSRPMRGAGASEDCVVPLKRATTVTLTVQCNGHAENAHAVWFEPCFVKE
jgi:hypothetical protein